MRCPRCQADDTKVIDSREAEDGSVIRRRRSCVACTHRFTTYERPDVNFPSIVKKDGRRADVTYDDIGGLGDTVDVGVGEGRLTLTPRRGKAKAA